MNITIDDELRLLKGSSFFIDKIEIKQLTLNEITDFGYTKYQQMLNVYILELEDIVKEIPEEFNEIKIFDLLLNSGIDDLLENLLSSIYLFFKPNKIDVISNEIILDDKKINRDNWDFICEIIKMQNCVKRAEKEEYNPGNERARKFIEKLNAMKKDLPKIKSDITLPSMISGVAWKAQNINIKNIWDLTIYQLYDALNRLNLIDDYQFTLTGIFAGTVDGKKIDMKKINWIKNII